MGSLTRLTTFERLESKGEMGVVLGRLMLAVNDVTLANEALGHWMGPQEGMRAQRHAGAKMYFVRTLIAHCFEALKIITKIASTPELLSRVETSPGVIRKHFETCRRVIGTDKYKLLKAVRNDASFHYLDQTVRNALASQRAKAPNVPLSLSVGDGTLDWYFEPADRLVDSAIVRDVFEIPEGADVQKEVDKLIHGLQDIADAFVLFAGYFIMEHAN